MNRLEKLIFSIGLIDKASGPASKITSKLDKLFQTARAGMANMAAGAAGLFAVGYGLKSFLGPAIEMERALGEVRSLGVYGQALQTLERTAYTTSIQYGGSASEFVRASYDIQSAIAGLHGNELPAFTRASAILAKGTKSDTAVITDYMGTMYGIFQKTATGMGRAKWVDMLAGQTATAVQMFKTTGGEMAASFANLGAEAQSHGVGMAEQMAILGTLQATMSGTEAGTKYKSFLAGVGKAQDTLGMQFTDSQGRMLPMLDILEKLRGRFGAIDTVAESDLLQKAFGRKEAVGLMKLLMQNTDGLASSIENLGNVTGLERAAKMAAEIADPWERLSAAGSAAKSTLGRVLQPVLNPLIEKLIAGGETIVRWTELFPALTRVVGAGVLAIFAMIAAVSTLALVGGIAQLAMAGWGVAMVTGQGIMFVLSGAMKAVTLATWLFNAALWANPITWIVAAVIALIAVVGALIYYWDDVTAAVDKFTKKIRTAFDLLTGSKAYKVMKTILSFTPLGLLGKAASASVNLLGTATSETNSMRVAAPDLQAGKQNTLPDGGISNTLNQNRGTHIEKLEVNTTGGVNGFQFADELLLAGG